MGAEGTEVVEPARGATDEDPSDGLRPYERNILVGAAAIGLFLVVAAGWLTDVLVDVLPQSVTVRSGGTSFGGMATVGTHVFRLTGIALVAGAAAGAWLRRLPWTDANERQPAERDLLVRRLVVFGVPFLAYLYLASPHNSFPTNSRIHWVDYTSWRSDDFFYAAGRLPHAIFYRHPAWWQALNAGLLALTVDAILRRVGMRRPASLMLTFVFMSSSTLLVFANTAEDVLLNFLLLALLVLAMTTDHAVLRGAALAATVLGRPNFLALFGAYVAVWAVLWGQRTLRRRRTGEDSGTPTWRGLVPIAWGVGFVALSQLVMTIVGRRYLLTGGKLIDLGPLTDLQPIDTDGFLISPFSGAYLGHLLWLVPVVLPATLIAGVVLWLADGWHRTDGHDEVVWWRRGMVLLFSASATATLLFVHEAKPLIYFNFRYMSYSFPFLFLGAVAGARHVHRRSRALATGALVASSLGVYVLPIDPIAVRNQIAERAEVYLYPHMERLQQLAEGRTVYLSYGGTTVVNALAYVLHQNPGSFEKVTAEDLDAVLSSPQRDEVLAFARCAKHPDLHAEDVVLRTHGLCVVAPGS